MRLRLPTPHLLPPAAARTPAALSRVLPAASFLLAAAFAAPALAAVEIVHPQGVENRFTSEREGKSYLVVDRVAWELITDPADPSLSRLGDGSFHPMNPQLVRDAVAALDRAGAALRGRIFILPYPRRENLKSSCENGDIYLSPGIREVAAEHVHATTTHELGHLLQTSRALEGTSAWEEYLDLRELRSPRFASNAAHRDRPREIFAEDFRFLFGSPLATSSGSIENGDLPLPTQVPGLREWFEELLRSPMTALDPGERLRPESFPNPLRPLGRATIAFEMSGPRASTPDRLAADLHAVVFDLAGREVRRILGASSSGDGRALFTWDGRGADGAPVPSGVYFVRWNESPESGTARVQVLR